ncbi:putative 28S rRNA (cytosine(4447)-C(5))-methyltransferase [Chionoecetes opilio]|uniref:Putative 28S rRNA (Cytosine(4447)-C(5))-methyltransferase n=1 Tax=Chionoecetes opilio TaxID=41210 RepID=A0A8J4XRL8_CHIOP|nr:putative 28S rRNA (cytosine(4447)-C(5))-methyltransferase [Chionoecetes opilio]
MDPVRRGVLSSLSAYLPSRIGPQTLAPRPTPRPDPHHHPTAPQRLANPRVHCPPRPPPRIGKETNPTNPQLCFQGFIHIQNDHQPNHNGGLSADTKHSVANMPLNARLIQKSTSHQGQGHGGQSNPNSMPCIDRGQRRARVMADVVKKQKDTEQKVHKSKRERHLFHKKVLYELDKVDDLIQDFAAILHQPFAPPPAPVPCLHGVGPHHRGSMKTLKELSGESGLSLHMLGRFPRVMSRQEVPHTLEAIAFTPPVTFLRINLLKGSPKEVWQELTAGDVSAWLPRWSNVTMLAVDDPNNLCPLIRKLIAEGKCFQQGSISSLVVMVLSAKAAEDVLELCATNSGKTPHIAAMQMNSGKLVANTLHAKEVQAMMDSNSHHDVQNCVVTHIEPAELAKMQAGRYQRVLVDAPSSGAGMVRLPPGARVCRTLRDLNYISTRQKLLLINGADCVKQSVEENEEVVQHLLVNRPQFRLVPTGLDIGQPGLTHYKTHNYHEDMCHARRIYCHHYHMDGAFIAKFVLDSEVNALETSKTKKLLQKQANKQQEQNTSKINRDKKAGVRHTTAAKSTYKKGSHEWLTQTLLEEKRRGDDYSDED